MSRAYAAPRMPAAKPPVDPATFFALDQRVGRVVDVEAFPEARTPAWKLTVDFGADVGVLRTSAQVTNYSPDELTGRLVVGVVNLGEKRIAGFASQFLVLGSITADDTVLLLEPDPAAQPGDHIA